MKKLILITNDDGVRASGLTELIKMASKYGDVVVVAPDGARSGQSNAITMTQPLYLQHISQTDNVQIYQFSGTPTDCVKLALNSVLERKPDIILSGINHGSNASINVIYSGTMGAVLEGCSQGITSIGFSLCDHSLHADFSMAFPYFELILKRAISHSFPQGVCLNVNAPLGKIKGILVCRQSKGFWKEDFEEYQTPMGQPFYLMSGRFTNLEPNDSETDEWALANGYVSIVPTTYDITHYDSLKWLKANGYDQTK